MVDFSFCSVNVWDHSYVARMIFRLKVAPYLIPPMRIPDAFECWISFERHARCFGFAGVPRQGTAPRSCPRIDDLGRFYRDAGIHGHGHGTSRSGSAPLAYICSYLVFVVCFCCSFSVFSFAASWGLGYYVATWSCSAPKHMAGSELRSIFGGQPIRCLL